MAEKDDEGLDDLLAYMDEDTKGPVEPDESDEPAEAEVVVSVESEEEILLQSEPQELVLNEDAPRVGVEIDEDEAEIERLRAQLSSPAPSKKPTVKRPIPESKLTPKQKEIRDLQDALAAKKAREIIDAGEVFEDPEDSEEVVLIHFLEDGFTAQGRVWFRGQEVRFLKNGQAWLDTFDRTGDSWLENCIDDEGEQYARWGRVMFRRGPWRGKASEVPISREERLRNNAAPVINAEAILK